MLGLAACLSRSSEEPTLLEDLPGITLGLTMSPVSARVGIEYRENTLGACAILHESFRASINGVAMAITKRGGGPDTVSCIDPALRLDGPPLAADAVLTLEDDSKRLDIGLTDLLAPRSIQRVPAASWRLEIGEPTTVRYTPASDLTRPGVHLMFATGEEPNPTRREVPFTVSGDLMTFSMSGSSSIGRLEMWFNTGGPVPSIQPCAQVTCMIMSAPRLVQPIEVWPAGSFPRSGAGSAVIEGGGGGVAASD